jgi:dienelactone hydrolase
MRTLSILCTLALVVGCAHNTQQATAPAAIVPAPNVASEITVQEVAYKAGDSELKGYLAYPTGFAEKRPGVLVVHEWWGLNDYARSRARQLAGLGYVAFAADLYGGGKSTDHPEDAKAMMTALMSNPQEAVARFEAAKNVLASDPHVDPSRLAAIGYCMGGAAVLQAMRRGDDFDAVASFHGNYATQAPLQRGVYKGRVFIAHGAEDGFSTPEQVGAIQKELADAEAKWEFVAYPGAKHGFTNPQATEAGQKSGLPLAYDEAADKQSWDKLQQVLSEAFTQS